MCALAICTIAGAAPQITSQPTAPVVVTAGQVLSLSVSAQGEGTLQYQWFKNGVEMPGEVGPVLDFLPLALGDSGRYEVRVTDLSGSLLSSAVILRVAPGSDLQITSQPQGITVQEGVNTSIRVEASGSGTLRYQWYHNGRAVTGGTTAVLQLQSVRLGQAGAYYVEVSDSTSTVTSRQVELIVLPGAVQIVDQIGDQMLHSGQSVSLWVEVAMQEPVPLQYQWFRNGAPVTFATGPTLQISSFSVANEGVYTVRITTPSTTLESEPINVQLNRQGIFITRNPGSYEVLIGGQVTFSVEAVSERPLTYQWFHNNVEIPGAISPQLTIPAVSSSDSGDYHVQISNSISFASSLKGRLLTYEGALKVEKHPEPRIGLQGQSVTLSAKIIGSESIAYQWLKNGDPVTGATAPTLNLANLSMDDAGMYSLRGQAGDSVVETRVAEVVVQEMKISILNQPEDQRVVFGDSISLSVIASSPRSIEYQWFFNGVAVPNSNSAVLIIPDASAEDQGQYHVRLRSMDIEVESEKAAVTVGKLQLPRSFSVRIQKGPQDGFIQLSWPHDPEAGVELQSSPLIGPDASWTRVDVTPDVSSGESATVSFPGSGGNIFFRLQAVP